MQEKLLNMGCPAGDNSLAVVFRNHARCKSCKVRRRTVFSKLDTADLDEAGAKQMVYMEKNSVVLRSGETVPFLYCIREGWCRVTMTDPEKKTTTLWYAGPGDMLGLSSVCTGEHNLFTVIAIDNVTLCRIPADNFRGLMTSMNGLSLRIAEKLSEEVGRLEKRTDALRRRIIQKETARALLRVFKKSDAQKEKRISLLYFVREINVSRQAVKDCLDSFVLGKLIRNQNGKISITDKDRLIRVAMNDEEWA